MIQAEHQSIVDRISIGDFPLPAKFTAGVCDRTGRPKVSCGLIAPDARANALAVKSGLKAGGIGWPAHTVVLASDNPSEREIVQAALDSFDLALKHEGREWFSLDGKLFDNPHP